MSVFKYKVGKLFRRKMGPRGDAPLICGEIAEISSEINFKGDLRHISIRFKIDEGAVSSQKRSRVPADQIQGKKESLCFSWRSRICNNKYI